MRYLARAKRHGRRLIVVPALVAAALLAARQASASIDFSISPPTTSAAAGSTGDSFDVTLTNTGTADIDVGSFAFELSVSSTSVSFTAATTATSSPYVFAGSSLFGPTISFSPPGQVLQASDVTTLPSGVAIAPGATVGLGHVLFNVSPNAPTTTVPVQFSVFPATSLTDSSLDNITIDSYASGAISIQGNSGPMVPEPSMFTIFAVGIGLVAAQRAASAWGRRNCSQSAVANT